MMEKQNMNFSILGYSDSGKSTLAGHLLLQLGYIKKETFKQFEMETRQLGLESFKYSWLVDLSKEERTVRTSKNYSMFTIETINYRWTATVLPGHPRYFKNYVNGLLGADVVLILIFNEYFLKFLKEYIIMINNRQISQVIIGINAMELSNYSEEHYLELKQKVILEFEKLRYNHNSVIFIPVSGFEGENLKTKSKKMPWYTGDSLINILDKSKLPEKYKVNSNEEKESLRVIIYKYFRISGVGRIMAGRVVRGIIRVGQIIKIHKMSSYVKSIEVFNKKVEFASIGEEVGLLLTEDVIFTTPYPVLGNISDPPKKIKSFKTVIKIINNKIKKQKIKIGYSPVFYFPSRRLTCRFEEFISILDKTTLEEIKKNPEFLENGDTALVKISVNKHLIADDSRELGSFIIRDLEMIIAQGYIKSVEY
jgi:elongation factor 1-alpha